MHLKSGKIEIMINDKADEVIKEVFKLLQNRCQNNLEKYMKVSEFVSLIMFINCIINVIK